MTIHLVYVKGFSRATPTAITNELAVRLAGRCKVRTYNFDDAGIIRPQPGDVLIGHPHPDPASIFVQSCRQEGWRKRIVMQPFAHGRECLAGFARLNDLIQNTDHFLAICARYWIDTLAASPLAHWAYKIRQLDLAVDRRHFPPVKRMWNPPGRRRFIYVGHTAAYKGVDCLAALADHNPHLHVAWMGPGQIPSVHLKTLGYQRLADRSTQRILRDYDFLLTCGRADANPTTVLEAASLGLIPICTPQSGYYRQDWIVNISLDDIEGASKVLNHMNSVDESELTALRAHAETALNSYYTWDRFANDVMACIEAPPACRPDDKAWRQTADANAGVLAKIAAGSPTGEPRALRWTNPHRLKRTFRHGLKGVLVKARKKIWVAVRQQVAPELRH